MPNPITPQRIFALMDYPMCAQRLRLVQARDLNDQFYRVGGTRRVFHRSVWRTTLPGRKVRAYLFSVRQRLANQNIATAQGSPKPESPFSAPVTRNYTNPETDCEAKRTFAPQEPAFVEVQAGDSLRPCLVCLIESPPNQFFRYLSILLRIRVGYSTGVVPTLSWRAGRPGNGLVWAGEARPAR